jgi:uncharacterized protein YceK
LATEVGARAESSRDEKHNKRLENTMTARLSALALCLALCLPLAGCGTIVSKFFQDDLPEAERVEPGVYSGVRTDWKGAPIWWAGENDESLGWTMLRRAYLILYFAIDFPLSAVADTILLPYDLLAGSSDG